VIVYIYTYIYTEINSTNTCRFTLDAKPWLAEISSVRGVREMPMLFRNSTGSRPVSWRGSSIPLCWRKRGVRPFLLNVLLYDQTVACDSPDRWCLLGFSHTSEVFIAVPDSFGEGGVVREQGLSTGTRVWKQIVFVSLRFLKDTQWCCDLKKEGKAKIHIKILKSGIKKHWWIFYSTNYDGTMMELHLVNKFLNVQQKSMWLLCDQSQMWFKSFWNARQSQSLKCFYIITPKPVSHVCIPNTLGIRMQDNMTAFFLRFIF